MNTKPRAGSSAGACRAWLLLAFASYGCAHATASSQPASSLKESASVWSPFWGETEAGQTTKSPGLEGRVFAMRIDQGGLNSAVWIECPVRAQYRYEPIAQGPLVVQLDSPESLIRFFPLGYRSLRPVLEQGQRVRLEYAIAGRLVLDKPPGASVRWVCGAATHYVRTLLVGAYRVWVLPGTPQDQEPALTSYWVQTRGRPLECLQKGRLTPGAGCLVPLAFDLRAMPFRPTGAKLRLSDVAGVESIPAEDTLPGSPP